MELQENAELLEVAISSVDMTVWDYDPLKRTITQTVASIRQHGFDKVIEDVPESLIADGYVHPDSANAYRTLFQSIDDAREMIQGDFLVRSPGNDGYWWERVILTPIFDSAGKRIKIIGTSINVTERKEKEARYLRQLDSMSEVDDENLIAKGRHNITKNINEFYSGRKEGSLVLSEGGSYDEAIERLANSAVDAAKQQEIRKAMSRAKLLYDFIEDMDEGSLEYKRLMPNGETSWVLIRYSLYEEPLTNDVIAFIYSYDITERVIDSQIVSKLSSMEYDALGLLDVKTHQYALRNILNRIEGPTVIGQGDFDDRVRNRLPKVLVPSECEDVIKKFNVDSIVAKLEKKDIYFFTYSIIDDKHEVRRKKCQFSYLDESKSTILYCRSDITEMYQKEQEQLRQTEEALQIAEKANQAKSVFLSQMSHDIRTPMNTIINLTKLVREEIDDKEAVLADLKKIETSNQFLLSLVNDILDMSRIEQKKIELQPERYSYREFMDYIESTFVPLSKEKGIQFTISQGEVTVDVIIDKVRFNQICFNLISNAIKYTPTGGHVQLVIKNDKIVDGVFPCHIYVIDDGIGMSEEFQTRMFEPFAQEGRAYRSVEGTGLGLSIVKEIVELLGGTIEVTSAVDQGSTFHIYLELKVADEQEKTVAPTEQVDISCLAGKRVLLAEDHPLNQEITRRLLNHVGMEMEAVNNGKLAVEEFLKNSEDYDAILMDMRMPVMDGLTATRMIRQLTLKKAQSIPIIAMTANAFEEDREASAKAGMNAHLAKPIDAKLMYETLARCINHI